MLTRRSLIKKCLATGAFASVAPATAFAGAEERPSIRPRRQSPVRRPRAAIFEKVRRTPFIDTHEHLIDEEERLQGAANPKVPCDDWALLFSHYLNSDLLVAGMPASELNRFLSPEVEPLDKWRLLKPWWPAVKHTGYAQAVRIAIKELYAVEDLDAGAIGRVQQGYEATRRRGFYARVLRDVANVESCQVNSLTGEPFKETTMPTLLMQDLSIVGMFSGPDVDRYAKPAGIEVKSLSDWSRVIDWWFERYGPYAVAVKSQQAYSRDIDYQRVPADRAVPVFQRVLSGESVSGEDRKALEDHLFWLAADGAARAGLPIKLHTGYYAGQNYMPLDRLIRNPGSATDLCRAAPDATFVFMHICYPYYEEILSVAKHYTNACIDMCWSWIINPIAAKDFLKKYLVTAPANKIFTFGGDYIPVEPVVGHAALARRGIALALAELVEEGWLSQNEAIDLTDPIMHGNARTRFRLAEKTKRLEQADWLD